jgi:hypothetical protein
MQSRNHPVMEYIMTVFKVWCNHISGPILAVVGIVLAIAAAHYANDAEAGVRLVKWSAWLTTAASILLIFVAQYDAWKAERALLEQEKEKHVGSHVTGRMDSEVGFLDFRTCELPAKGWRELEKGCAVHVYLSAVNHNDCDARFYVLDTTAEMRVGEKCFHGKYTPTPKILSFHNEQ